MESNMILINEKDNIDNIDLFHINNSINNEENDEEDEEDINRIIDDEINELNMILIANDGTVN